MVAIKIYFKVLLLVVVCDGFCGRISRLRLQYRASDSQGGASDIGNTQKDWAGK